MGSTQGSLVLEIGWFPTDFPGCEKEGQKGKGAKPQKHSRRRKEPREGGGGEQGKEREDYCSAELEGALQLP